MGSPYLRSGDLPWIVLVSDVDRVRHARNLVPRAADVRHYVHGASPMWRYDRV